MTAGFGAQSARQVHGSSSCLTAGEDRAKQPEMPVLLAPVLALFEPGFYVRAARSSVRYGLAYLAYLATLTAVGTALMLAYRWGPMLDDLARWVSDRVPTIEFTADGPRVAGPEPIVLEHPLYGPLLRVDTRMNAPDPGEPAIVTLDRRRLTVGRLEGNRREELQSFEVVPGSEAERREWKDVLVDGDTVRDYYQMVRALAWLIVPLVLAKTFVWKLGAAVLYSGLALALSTAHRERLPYGALLNVAIFALTPATVLQWLSGVGLVDTQGLGPSLAVLATSAYLVIGVRAAARSTPAPAGGT